MRKLFPILFLPLFIFIACEDEEEGYDCNVVAERLADEGFSEMLAEYMTAVTAGDTTYEQPSDWETKCHSYHEGMLELANEGCWDDDPDITVESINEIEAFCDM